MRHFKKELCLYFQHQDWTQMNYVSEKYRLHLVNHHFYIYFSLTDIHAPLDPLNMTKKLSSVTDLGNLDNLDNLDNLGNLGNLTAQPSDVNAYLCGKINLKFSQQLDNARDIEVVFDNHKSAWLIKKVEKVKKVAREDLDDVSYSALNLLENIFTFMRPMSIEGESADE